MRALARVSLVCLAIGASACSGGGSDDAPGDGPGAETKLSWSQAWGSSGDDFARSLVVDSDGSSFAAGFSDGAFEGAENAGSWDAFLTHWSPDGEALWTREWGGAGPEFAQAVVADGAGHAFVAGYTPTSIDGQLVVGGHDAFLTMYDADGTYGWTREWGTDADDYVYAAAGAPHGVAVVGYTKGAFEGFENAGEADAFVTLVDASGSPLWSRQLGTEATDYAQAVYVSAAGTVLVAGYTAGKLGDDPDLGAEDAFLLALDLDGNVRWLRQWGSETTDYALSVSGDAAGNIYVTGYAYGGVAGQEAIGGEDAYLTKFDANGELSWTRQFGTTSRDSARFVSVDEDGNALVGGDTEGAFATEASAGGRDAFLARFDHEGTQTFAAQWGGAGSEFSLSGDVAPHELFVTGYVEPAEGTCQALLTRFSF